MPQIPILQMYLPMRGNKIDDGVVTTANLDPTIRVVQTSDRLGLLQIPTDIFQNYQR